MTTTRTIEIKCQSAMTLLLDEVHPFQGELKSLSKENYDKLRASFLDVGFVQPLSVWRDPKTQLWMTQDGHQRERVLKEMRSSEGFEIPPLPCSIVQADNEHQAKKIILYLTSQYGTMEKQGLYSFMSENNIEIPALDNFRFPEIDIPDFKFEFFDDTPPNENDPDHVPATAQNERGVQVGDVWQLGNHKIMCGDSTDPAIVEKLMNGEKATMWQTDPPYGINHVEVSQEKGQSKGYENIANDDLADEKLQDFIYKAIKASLPHMEKNFAFYMWHAMKMQAYFSQAAAAAGILFHRQIIWAKPQFVFGRGHYHWKHELCLMGWLQGNEPPFYGERNQSTIWEVGRENDKIHPTQKPVALWEPPISNHTKQGEIIYEPFSGSGSQIIACEKNNRRCFAMELEPHYVSVAIKRWEEYSGKGAVKL